MSEVLNDIIKEVVPNKETEDKTNRIAKKAKNLVEISSKKYPQVTGVEFGGSFAKGTWIGEKADIDIFIKFNPKSSESEFIEISKIIGFESMKNYGPYIRYSDHPYVEAVIEKIKINIVPCYDVPLGQWKSAADRSIHHTKFMRNSLKGNMKNEVRILKQFLKSNGVYGAEIAKQGFSGYVAEVLIYEFKKFFSVIKNFAEIKEGTIIGKTSKKFESVISIIDPIDENRNLATAISNENIGKFVMLCRSFEKNPDMEFFYPSKLIKKKNIKNILVIKLSVKERSPDILWGQIKKATSNLVTQLNLNGFKVIRSKAVTNERDQSYFIFFLESLIIPIDRIREGPSLFFREDAEKFIQKNIKKSKLIWINGDNKILCLGEREFFNAEKFLDDLLRNNVEKSGIPKGLKSDINSGFEIISDPNKLDRFIKKEINELVSTDEKIFH